MIVGSFYRGHRIEVYAERVDGAWDATVRIRRVLTEAKPHVERVTCHKLSAELTETRATINQDVKTTMIYLQVPQPDSRRRAPRKVPESFRRPLGRVDRVTAPLC